MKFPSLGRPIVYVDHEVTPTQQRSRNGSLLLFEIDVDDLREEYDEDWSIPHSQSHAFERTRSRSSSLRESLSEVWSAAERTTQCLRSSTSSMLSIARTRSKSMTQVVAPTSPPPAATSTTVSVTSRNWRFFAGSCPKNSSRVAGYYAQLTKWIARHEARERKQHEPLEPTEAIIPIGKSSGQAPTLHVV